MAENNQNSDNLEARDWLKNNKNDSALATNRFNDTKTALQFVEKLYSLGAVEVTVDGIRDEEWRIEREGGPYADSLFVELPSDPEKRKELFKVFNEEAEREGFDRVEDKGEERYTLWWD